MEHKSEHLQKQLAQSKANHPKECFLYWKDPKDLKETRETKVNLVLRESQEHKVLREMLETKEILEIQELL